MINIICCLYNTPTELFKKSIDSALSQTFKDFEFIIMNDGSDKYLEENIEYIESLNDNRFKIYHKNHDGKSNTINEALKLCSRKYIAIWDSDDVFYPNRLEYQYNILENTNIECLSNCMIDDNHIISPVHETNQYINKHNVHYLAFHPCQMFNRELVMNKVPYLFENCYDSMEDSIFNHIMFYHNVIMFYDNNILGNYCIKNPNNAHQHNLYGYLKFCTENLRYKSIDNIENNLKNNDFITVILVVNSSWKTEIEKTIFNIRITSEKYVDIIVAAYNMNESDLYDIQKIYNVKVIHKNSYKESILEAINNVTTQWILFINNPIRICSEMWDWKIERLLKNEIKDNNVIIQPLLFDMEKQDENYYKNSRGKCEKHNIQYGERLVMLTGELTEPINEMPLKSEYITWNQIPVLNDSLCFFITKENMLNKIQYIHYGPDLNNVIYSLIQYNDNNRILMCYDVQMSIDKINYNKKHTYIYNTNFYYIVNTFFYETKHIYEHIFNQIQLNIDLYKDIYDNIKPTDLKVNLYNFYKNINCKQSWII